MPSRPLPRWCICLLPLCLSLLVGCAKTAEPEPPVARVARPASDLAAQQYDATVILKVTAPTENTDGTRMEGLRTVEVFRVTENDRGSSAPLPDDEYLARADRIYQILGDEIPALLKEPGWTFRDDLAGRAPDELYRRGYLYAVRFINSKNQTAGLSNQAYIAPIPLPAPPTDLACRQSQDEMRLTWKPPQEYSVGPLRARIAGYRIYRSEDPQHLTDTVLNSSPVEKPEFDDRSFQFDKTYYYSVSVIGSLENPFAESLPSVPLRVETRDTFPPGPPEHLDGVVEGGIAILLWTAPEAPDLAGYRVYRQREGSPQRELLNKELIRGQSFRDEHVAADATYDYGVAAVDTHGNEGAPATIRLEMPRQPGHALLAPDCFGFGLPDTFVLKSSATIGWRTWTSTKG